MLHIGLHISSCDLVTLSETGEEKTESGIEIKFSADGKEIYTDYLDSLSRYCQYDRCKVIRGFSEAYAEHVVHSIQKLDNVKIWAVVVQVAAKFESELNEFLKEI